MYLRKFLSIFSVLASISIVIFSTGSQNQVSWPSIDNLPAVCRLLDRSCLMHDFFTNASYDFNPRSFYIYTLAFITKILNLGVAGGLVFIKALLIICMPIVALVFFTSAIERDYGYKSNYLKYFQYLILASFPIALYLIINDAGKHLSIAWWRPLTFEPTAQNFSLLLTLLAGILFLRNKKISAALVFFIAGLYHPSVALLSAIFLSTISIQPINKKVIFSYIKFIFIPIFLSGILIKLIFRSGTTLSVNKLFQIYVVEGHPFHYLPSQFGTFTNYPWWYTFIGVSVGILMLSIILFALRQPAWKNSLLFLSAYLLAILFQYAFVEKFHIRPFIELGASRFAMFGAWGIYYFSLISIGCMVTKFFSKKSNDTSEVKKIEKLKIINYASYFIYIIPASLLILWLLVYINRASFILWSDEKSIGVVNYAKQKTDESVWLIPFNISRAEFPFFTNKAVFIGNGFPFNEKYLEEWGMRNGLVNGNNEDITKLPGSWIGEQWSNFYRNLGPKDIYNIGSIFRLDYFVVERNFESNFKMCNFIYSDEYYKIITFSDIKKCVYPK